MQTTRNQRVPMSEQIRLITECRRNGMTDADWCRVRGIAPSTFYNWVSRCRKAAAGQIPAPCYDGIAELHCEDNFVTYHSFSSRDDVNGKRFV